MSINEQINDLIEYKRLVIKLEDEINKKNSENSTLLKHNSDLKSLCQELQNECDDLNKKLISKNSEINKLNKKYKEELVIISSNFEKQKLVYEEKILKLSSINPMNKEISIQREVEIKYDQKLKEKDCEIVLLKKQIQNLKDENFELGLDIERIKNTQNKLNNIKEEKNLIEDIVRQEDNEKDEINNNDYNKEELKQMQLIIKDKEEKIEKLYQEMHKLKNDKNTFEANLSRKYFFDLSKFKELEDKNNILKREISLKDSEIKGIENKLIEFQDIVETINKEKDDILSENNNLLLKIKELEKDSINNDEIQRDLENLRELVQKYESDQNYNNLINEKIKKQNEEKNNNKINELQKKIEEQSNIIESNNFKSNNNNYINIIEYKNNDSNSNIFKIEYEKIHQKYNLLLIEEKRRANDLRLKDEENEQLNKYLKESIKKENKRKEKYYQLKEKYKILLDKKEHYKELCKISQKNLENLINLLNPEQKKSIENSENKYLIDVDSFSFTEYI